MHVQRAALEYLSRGCNPLPSSRASRHPVVPYAEYWDRPVDASLISNWPWEVACNVQVMCGTRWNLAVIDLDGPHAPAAWEALTLHRPAPRTWTVRTGGGGLHLWYSTPPGLEALPSVTLWCGGNHNALELLADRKLVIAPPSRHWRTGMPYRWLVGPGDMPRPAILPGWIVDVACHIAVPEPAPVLDRKNLRSVQAGHFDRREVLAALPDPTALVRSWGLRVVGSRPGCRGWLACRAIDRPDGRPSAGWHPGSCYYSEPARRLRLSLYECGVALGRYRTWTDAVDDLGREYLKAS